MPTMSSHDGRHLMAGLTLKFIHSERMDMASERPVLGGGRDGVAAPYSSSSPPSPSRVGVSPPPSSSSPSVFSPAARCERHARRLQVQKGCPDALSGLGSCYG